MPTVLKYKCPKCGARYEYGDDEAGTPVTCECGRTLLFPAAPIPAPAPPPAPTPPPGPNIVERFTPAAVQFGATVAAALKSPPPPPPPTPEQIQQLQAAAFRADMDSTLVDVSWLEGIVIVIGAILVIVGSTSAHAFGHFQDEYAPGATADAVQAIFSVSWIVAGVAVWALAALMSIRRHVRANALINRRTYLLSQK